MALIKCPECGKEISDKSTNCIHCGYPLEHIQKSKSEPRKSQSTIVSVPKTEGESLGFTLFSLGETDVLLECKKCSKVYKFNRADNFSVTANNECIPNSIICCPNCKNTAEKGSKIHPKQKKSAVTTTESKQTTSTQTTTSNTDDDGQGCLIFIIILCIVAGIIFWIFTDGFKDFTLWWSIFPILIVVFICGGVFYSIASSDPEEVKQNWDKEKYNDYRLTCPVCGSNKVKRIGTVNRVASVAAVGLASSKIGKQYECDSCKHKW